MSLTRWNQPASHAPASGRPAPEIVSLPAGTPDLEQLFVFARDAELRFSTLRLRIEERTATASGDRLVISEVAVAHPGHARVLTSEPALGTAANYEIWLSDGVVVRTYSARDGRATERPVRPRLRGIDQEDLPARAGIYIPLTPLPAPSLPDTFVHPGGYCRTVLSTGRCRIVGSEVAAGREAIVLECDHPRSTHLHGDRPDYQILVAFDRLDGVITRLVESIGGVVTREARVVAYETDVSFPSGTFELTVPEGTHLLY